METVLKTDEHVHNILDKLLFPNTSKQFFSEYFDKQFHHISNRSSEIYNSFITIDDIDAALVSEKIKPSDLSMAQNTLISFHHWSKILPGHSVKIDRDKIKQNLYSGNSLVINSAEKFIPTLDNVIKNLSDILQSKVWSNLYITPSGYQAFNRHYDTHDVLVLQLKGIKNWKLFDSPIVLPHASQPYDKSGFDLSLLEPIKELTISPGDILYLPRGVVHEAIALDQLSIHLTIGFKPPIVADILDGLHLELIKHESFRKGLVQNSLNEIDLKKSFISLLNEISFKDLIKNAEKKYSNSDSKANDKNIIKNYTRTESISLESIVKKSPGKIHIKMEGQHLHIEKNGKQEVLPFFLNPILNSIITSGDKGIKLSLIKTTFDKDNFLKLIHQLIKKGYIELI